MKKRLIGIFRIITFIYILPLFGIDLSDSIAFKNYISELIYGEYNMELRNSGVVVFFALISYLIISFYIIQSIIYILIGPAFEDKNTGLFRFVGYVISGIRDYIEDPRSSSSEYDLNRLEEVMRYRDSKMKLMSNKDAVEYMKGSGYVEHLMSRRDLKRSREVLSYLNNKVNLMDNERAFNFIKNQK